MTVSKPKKNSFVAFYTIPKKKGLSLDSQKAIVNHFVKIEKGTIVREFISDTNDKAVLKEAIKYCKDSQEPLMIASLDVLGNDAHLIMWVKKQLGKLFVSCDLPASDSLTLSIALQINQRAKELISIRTKAAMAVRKLEEQTFGNVQNLTDEGRKLGLAKIKAKAGNGGQSQKVLEIIEKCRAAGMGLGKIARALNELGYRTVRGKRFYKETIKRLAKSLF